MYTPYETPGEFQALAAELKILVQEIASRFTGNVQTIHTAPNDDLSTVAYRNGKLHIVKEGMLACSHNRSTIFYYDQGDIIGLDHQLMPLETCRIWSELSVVVDEISIEQLLEQLASDWPLFQQWNRLLAVQMRLYLLCLASLAKTNGHHDRDVQHVAAGQTIIEQGTPAQHVYTLIDGQADVLIDGGRVGEILPGETFGAIAALTGATRSATVRAARDCIVMAMRSEDMRHLIESRPNAAIKLIQDMARVIADLNAQVVQGPNVPALA